MHSLRVRVEPSWFPPPGGDGVGGGGGAAPAANAAEAALLGRVRFSAQLHGAAALLSAWYWPALALAAGGVAAASAAAALAVAAALRLCRGGGDAPGWGLLQPPPRTLTDTVDRLVQLPPAWQARVDAFSLHASELLQSALLQQ